METQTTTGKKYAEFAKWTVKDIKRADHETKMEYYVWYLSFTSSRAQWIREIIDEASNVTVNGVRTAYDEEE